MDQAEHSMSRRALLKAGGAGATLGAVGAIIPLASAASERTERGAPDTGDGDPSLDLGNIQGNILGGFNKDHQRLLFFDVADRNRARQWLGRLVGVIASAEETVSFNAQFRRSRARRGTEAGLPTAQWVNVALTHRGLAALGVPGDELAAFPAAFRQGMAARAESLGDVDDSAPAHWVGPFAQDGVHGVLLLAADDAAGLGRLTREHRRRMTDGGLRVRFDQGGRTRVDEPGHEHFGFRDGISQPGIRGLTERQNPDDDGQGLPGQDLIWPGEFILGQPREPGGPGTGEDDDAPGPVATAVPAWTVDGSFLVFRRLRQDVAGFRSFLAAAAATQGLTADQMGAKVVGRYPSGAPLERTEDQSDDLDTTAGDPSVDDPGLLDDTRINNFEFGDDPDGLVVPRAAHIRKTYPRDSPTPTGAEADTQTHRLLRRGIPYGRSWRSGAPAGSDTGSNADRGLLFLCYQTDIERQFEFVQSQWVNNPDAPQPGDGDDLVIGQATATRSLTLPGGRPDHVTVMQRFVITTGGDYFLQPSLTALRHLSAPSPARRGEGPRQQGRRGRSAGRRPGPGSR